MKIVIDQAVPFIRNVFEPYAEVVYKDGAEISRTDLVDADALICRTRTECNAELLLGTAVQIIATTTVSTSNIDTAFCEDHGIVMSNAAGSNSGGVMNYVFSALYGAAARRSLPLLGATFGIVGVGSTGKMVERTAQHLGFKILRYDPPRAEKEGPGNFCDLDTLLESSDIVSLHLPTNDNTRNIANDEFFSKMRLGAAFINAASGDLVDEDALIRQHSKLGPIIIDTWKNEPDINLKLMDIADIATPHIAGYSYQGKLRSTMMPVRAVARYFGIQELYDFFPVSEIEELNAVKLDLKGKNQGQIASIMQYNYPIFTDDCLFRVRPQGCMQLRDGYKYRKEFYTD